MKKLIAILIALILCAGCCLSMAEAPRSTLEQADFTLETADGGVFTLSEHLGEVVFINFWATWCGPCCYELPGIDELAAYYAEAEDVTILTVNLGERIDTVQAFLADNGYTFPVACDVTNGVGMGYGVQSIPATLIFDKTGEVHGAWVGLVADVAEVCQHYVDIIEAIR